MTLAFHCHLLHHVMNQMGPQLPVLFEVNSEAIDRMVQSLLPYYLTIGTSGMREM